MWQEKARQDGVRQTGKIRRFGRKAEYGAERGIGGDETSIEAPPEDAARRLDRGRNTANTANSSVSLRARALGMLARREHSRAELARKLAAYAGSDEALAALLDDLEARRLLSDARYVEARLNARGARYGNRRLSQELRARGVDAALVETALAACGDEVARARQVWQRRFGALPPAAFFGAPPSDPAFAASLNSRYSSTPPGRCRSRPSKMAYCRSVTRSTR